MKVFPSNIGHLVNMKTKHPLHYSERKAFDLDKKMTSNSFMGMLTGAIGKVNDLQVQSDSLTKKMIYEPESVEVHTVMIAAQKAELALTMTKSFRDEAIRAFRELINLR
ncbi:flagellar hook-basal body complex protein FliE [Spirochaetota bacterium]